MVKQKKSEFKYLKILFKTDISQTASYLKPRQTEKNMTSKNVVIPTDGSTNPTFSDKPTEGFGGS